jgi:ABC-type nitrate/sulfonate/bicarbonate transport system substrate-binding protein
LDAHRASRTQGADSIIVAAVVNTLPYSLLKAKGITKWHSTKDIVILQGGTQPTRLQALSVGTIDATVVSPPLDLTAKKQGLSILVNVAELGIPYRQLVIETSDRFNRESPQTVKIFLEGFIEGLHYTATHKYETKKIIDRRSGDSRSHVSELYAGDRRSRESKSRWRPQRHR